jgi:alpha-glucosidase (family GH31 glycosyl hydrolase)
MVARKERLAGEGSWARSAAQRRGKGSRRGLAVVVVGGALLGSSGAEKLHHASSASVPELSAAGCQLDLPAERQVGTFLLRLTRRSALFTVYGEQGEALLEGVEASDDVGKGFASNEENPPLTGFAVRGVDTYEEMRFGAFRMDENPREAWTVVRRGRAASFDSYALEDDDGNDVLTLRYAPGADPNHLVMELTANRPGHNRASWGFRCRPEDRFLGFGWQSWGTAARGESIPTWVSEPGIGKDLTTDDPTGAWYLLGRRHSSHMPMPEFLTRRGAMVVVENEGRNVFAMCSENERVGRMQLELPAKVHVFYGPSPSAALARKTAHFGRPRQAPPDAFAPWNDAIFGSAEVRRVAKLLRDRKIPSSVIWTEDWRGGEPNPLVPDGYRLREEWDVDRTLYPDFEQVARELHEQGFKWHVYFAPFVVKDTRVWNDALAQGVLIQRQDGSPYIFPGPTFHDTSMLDLTNPKARAWAVAKMQAALALGADGFMGDYGEWLPTDARLFAGSARAVHNRYPVLWQEVQREAMDTMPDAATAGRLSFVRAGWFGTPQLADVFWAGDQSTDFKLDDGLPTIIPIGLGLGLSGVSTYGHDIAGYQTTNTKPATKELFFRWSALGAFSPVMRTHHGTAPKANWSFDRDEETLTHWTNMARQHMALFPYLRGLGAEATRTGTPIWRHLAFHHPQEDDLWSVSDEFLLGERVLVAPVVVEGALRRSVLLPDGVFYNFFDGAPVGAKRFDVDVPLGAIAVFARAGAIVPMLPPGVLHTEAALAMRDRVVRVFLGEVTRFSEEGGPRYALDAPAAENSLETMTFEETPLPTCSEGTPIEQATSDCREAGTASPKVRVRVTGSGTLRFGREGQRGSLTLAGVAPGARVVIELVRRL